MRLLTCVCLTLAVLACGDSSGPGRQVVLDVTALAAPDTVPAAGPLTVTVTVTVGGCLSFERFHVERTAARLDLVAVGRDGSGPGVACTADVRYEAHEYSAGPPFTDPFTVAVRQPDGSSITRQVHVR
ncbi:MAG TPA: hypothetical protein VF041_03215 [Gemmatimonadaceae bacterium]